MANFAKEQMIKYGWSEGKGLGKHENGIVEALKPKLKFDTTGIGHDRSEYHWWEFVYNKASSNLTVDTDEKNVRINIKDDDAVNIKTTKSELNIDKLRRERDLHYGSFIKTSTLENGKVTNDPDYVGDKFVKNENISQPFMLNDDELFKACGGRTAHKGARHGLKLNGKLARVERQEKELLQQMNELKQSDDWIHVNNKRKKKKKNRSDVMEIEKDESDKYIPDNELQSDIISDILIIPTDDYSRAQSKKTRRKCKRQLENLTHQLTTSLALSEDSASINDKKLSRKHEHDVEQSSKKNGKKRKHKKKDCDMINDEEYLINTHDDVDCIIEPMSKKCKRDKTLIANVLNSKIEKKKRNKKCKKERKRMEKLSTSLMTLDLIETNETNSNE